MADPEQIIPFDRLPPGFLDTIGKEPESPAVPRPAATVILMRQGKEPLEILLLRRARSSGFVPGAYVFPGGRVDPEDGDARILARLDGLTPAAASARLGLGPEHKPPALAYYIAAMREAFEETGLLPGTEHGTDPAARSREVAEIREAIMEGSLSWVSALDRLEVRLAGGAMEYVAHWITPRVEPRRYDTRFFAAEVERGAEAVIDRREMVDGVWLSPGAALDRNRRGDLPMVFPTLSTLRKLAEFREPSAVLEYFRDRDVPAILPRLVTTPLGVGLEVD